MGISDISPRDIEQISAYLDSELAPQEVTNLEARLWQEPQLRDALDELGRTRTMLRSMPRLHAPRNFTISPEMATKIKRRRFELRLYPIFGFASALATIVLLFVLSVDFLGVGDSFTAQSDLQPTSAVVAFEAAQPENAALVEPSPAALKMAEAPQAETQPAMADTSSEPTSEPIPTGTSEPESTAVPEATSESVAQATPDERDGSMRVVPTETLTMEQATSTVTTTTETLSIEVTETVSATSTQSPSPIPANDTQVPATQVAQAATQPPTLGLQPTIAQGEFPLQQEISPQRTIGEQPVLLVLEIGLGLLVLGTFIAALWSFLTRS